MAAVSEETVRRIEAYFAKLKSATHYEMLNLTPSCEDEAIKLAFRSLSREFHPDHFNTQPTHKSKVEAIYTRMLEAYRTLSNPARRAEYHQEQGFPPPGQVQQARTQHAKPGSRVSSSRMNRLKNVMADRIRRSREHLDRGKKAFDEGRWADARAAFQDALAVDPRSAEAREYMEKAGAKARNAKAEEHFQHARRAMAHQPDRAAVMLKAAINERPSIGRYHHALAVLLDKIGGEVNEQVDLLRHAIELEPQVPEYHKTLAEVYQEQGAKGQARAAWERVVALDPSNSEAKKALKRLK